ncbi:MAG: polysaccharide deacetylase family protein, partial [Gemmatimonadota bacterium]
MTVRHHLTIDVEEYFHASAMETILPRKGWEGLARRSPLLVGKILTHLAAAQVRGTFFVLGWL